MVQEIYIIDDDDSSILVFRELFKNDTDYKFISVKTDQIDIALKNIPSLSVFPCTSFFNLYSKITHGFFASIALAVSLGKSFNFVFHFFHLTSSMDYFYGVIHERLFFFYIKS